jgi:uroporphyrinogen-III synthase
MKCFVSRSSELWSAVMAECASMPIDWVCEPLIRTQSLSFQLPAQSFEWIFFSSREAVHHFFQANPNLPMVRYGAIGPSTAKALASFAPIDFVGQSADIAQVAEAFSQVVQAETVLFPGSHISLRSIQHVLPERQVVDLACYETHMISVQVPECDAYIFSSPSNVRSFFQSNALPNGAFCWAFGTQTAQCLLTHGCQQVEIFEDLQPAQIAHTIKQFFNR